MNKINSEELKQIQLDIMLFIHNFCQENKINYSMCYGTLLGAVRHKGYIPWDDDIDIMMPRLDYEKFSLLFNKHEGNYKFLNCFNDSQYFQPFGKVVNTKTYLKESYDRSIDNLGVYIDVFPIDGLPLDKKKRTFYWKMIIKRRNWNTLYYSKNISTEKGLKKIFRFILFSLFKSLPANNCAKKLNLIAMKNDFNSSDKVACSIFGYGKNEEVPHSIFDSYIDMKFEDNIFKACSGWDIYLKNVYGDYMKLPPESKRVAKHNVEVYWR